MRALREREMIEKIIKPTSHAKASLCMFNAAICLDNYDLVKHSGYLVCAKRSFKTVSKAARVYACTRVTRICLNYVHISHGG